MPAVDAKDAIRFLDAEIAARIDRSELGRMAYEDAGLEGPSHISAIIVSDARPDPQGGVTFEATVELHDADERLYEAVIAGHCARLDGRPPRWEMRSLQVLEAGPLPKSG